MKWIVSTLLGLFIAIGCYSTIGAFANLLIGPVLGYKIMLCSMWGLGIMDEEGRKKFCRTKFAFTPEVLLYVNREETHWKKLVLEIFPVTLGFTLCMLLSTLFGGVEGFGRYVLIAFLSGMAVIYCWHIFIVLKMIVYMRDSR